MIIIRRPLSPFQELALWPLVAVALRENDIEGAYRYAGLILDPSQRQLDDSLEQLIRSAILQKSPQLLQQAADIVTSQGYVKLFF